MVISVRLSEQVAAQLRDEIIAGELHPGEPLRLAALANRLGVSVTPVREALAMLDRQGLVVGQVHRGFRVAQLSPTDIGDVYALHAFMARRLTERAIAHLDDGDLDELEKLDDQMREVTRRGDKVLAGNLNHEIHRRISQASESPLLLRFIRETTPFVSRRHDPDLPGWAEIRLDGHIDIINAIRRRDAPRAAELMEIHILRSGQHAVTFAEQSWERGPRPG